MEKNIKPGNKCRVLVLTADWKSDCERDVFFTWPKNDKSEFLSFQWNISFLRSFEMKGVIDISLKLDVNNALLA